MTELYNRDIKSMLDKLGDVEKELRECQSSRLHVGMLSFDCRRLEEELTHIIGHAKAVTATDFPETHPTSLEPAT